MNTGVSLLDLEGEKKRIQQAVKQSGVQTRTRAKWDLYGVHCLLFSLSFNSKEIAFTIFNFSFVHFHYLTT